MKSHSSSVDDATADKVRNKIRGMKQSQPSSPKKELELPINRRSRRVGRKVPRPHFRPSRLPERPSIPTIRKFSRQSNFIKVPVSRKE